MFYCIEFRPSSVPWNERGVYVEKLNALCRQSKYQKAEAYRNEDSNDYDVIVRSEYEGRPPCDEKTLRKIFRELVKRGCVIQDLETGSWLFGKKRPDWF